MKYLSILLLAWLSITNQAGQGTFVCKNAKIALYSKAPIEDIEATSTTAVSVFNATNGDLAFSVNISSFKFEKALMQEHFNGDYMESDKFPKATFKGKIQEHVDVGKDGTFPVTATGDLTVHNVTQKRTIPGTLTVKGGVITITSEFMVKCADHNIEIPRLVFHNIAETIKMNVSATYTANKLPLYNQPNHNEKVYRIIPDSHIGHYANGPKPRCDEESHRSNRLINDLVKQ